MNKNPFNKDIMKLLWEKSNMKNIYEENREVLLKESGKYDSNKWFYSEDRKKLSFCQRADCFRAFTLGDPLTELPTGKYPRLLPADGNIAVYISRSGNDIH